MQQQPEREQLEPDQPRPVPTPAQIEAAPVGTLAHRNYQCPSLELERVKYAPPYLRHRVERQAEGNEMFERALVPSIAHTVKPPSVQSTFTWQLKPQGGTYQGTIYIDGSRLDGPDDLLARNGWAFVVINEDGEMIAAAYGVPQTGSPTSREPKRGPSSKRR